MPEPLFVLGYARSGTSLLARMLGNHPRLAVPYESHLYNVFSPRVRWYGELTCRRHQRLLLHDALRTLPMRTWSPQVDAHAAADAIRRPGFAGVVEAIFDTWARQVDKPRWCEKTPAHGLYWRQIASDFPDARFVIVVRDPRDVVLSLRKARFGPKHVYPITQQWLRYQHEMDALCANLRPERWMRFRYVDLIREPEAMLRQVCAFAGEDFDPAILTPEAGTPWMTDNVNAANLNKPVISDNAGKWQHQLSLRSRRIVEALAGPELAQLGYERTMPDATISRMEAWKCRWIEHPPRKLRYMLKNFRGFHNALINLRLAIVAWLRMHWLRRSTPTPPTEPMTIPSH